MKDQKFYSVKNSLLASEQYLNINDILYVTDNNTAYQRFDDHSYIVDNTSVLNCPKILEYKNSRYVAVYGKYFIPKNILINNIRIPEPEPESFLFTVSILDDNTYIEIPHSDDPSYIHDYDIDYGDGTPILHVSSYNDLNTRHYYTNGGTYQIKIVGTCETFFVNEDSYNFRYFLISIDSWGEVGGLKILKLVSCENLLTLSNEKGKLTNVTSFADTFYNCISLTSIPTGLFDNNINVTSSFDGTFNSCISLTSIPTGLFDYNINVTSFYATFGGCKSLTSIPSGLFDNNINVTSFSATFSNCISLTSIPTGLFNNNINVTSFDGTFGDCTSLTSIPTGLFDNNTLVTSFNSTFSRCYLLTSIPSGLFDNNTLVTSFNSTFQYCSTLTTIPTGLFDNNIIVTNFTYTFYYCTSLISIPSGLFDNNINVTSFDGTFHYCTSLTSIPTGLFDNNINVTSFADTFYNCISLTGLAPELWLSFQAPTRNYCFYNDTLLTNYNDIPSNWK